MKKFNITTPLNTLLSELPPGMTPQDKILYSARVNLSLNHQQTPSADDEGLEGLRTLKQMEAARGQPMRSLDRAISERMKTPLNEWEQDHGRVKSLFKNLRKPENVVEFDIPEEEEEDEDEVLEDAEEVERREREAELAHQQARLQLETEVIKRRLPRPLAVPSAMAVAQEARELIEQEMLTLIYSDAIDNPLDGVLFPDDPPPYKQDISLDRLNAARKLVEEELPSVKAELSFEGKYENARSHVRLDHGTRCARVVGEGANRGEQATLGQL